MKWGMICLVALPLAGVAACEADLETSCMGGRCDDLGPTGTPASSSATVEMTTGGGGGQGGAGGGMGDCFAGCDSHVAGPTVGELPCEIERIVANNCRVCHSASTPEAAPFPLDDYADTQRLYASGFKGIGSRAIWFLMHNAVSVEYMPLDDAPLEPKEDFDALLAWGCDCGPPRPGGEICD